MEIRIFKPKEVKLKELVGRAIVNLQADSKSFDIILEGGYILEVYWSGKVKASKMVFKNGCVG